MKLTPYEKELIKCDENIIQKIIKRNYQKVKNTNEKQKYFSFHIFVVAFLPF